MTKDKIKDILDMIDTLQEQLLSLPDDMLLSIDPRDNDSLEQGLKFIKSYNETLNLFTSSSTKLADQVKAYLGINPEEDELEQETTNRQKRDRIIKELDKTSPHTLEEDFTYKRPYGFILKDSAIKGLKTWKNMYLHVLNILKAKNPGKFALLPKEVKFISNRGNPLFSKTGTELRVAEKLSEGFFVEVNLSANNIRNNISDLLVFFDMEPMSMKVYLREDRDAE
ncbi:MAG: hypothetical protein K0B15_16415 [Lentimicrobium sp.]|nr:hypothetical protein [Lentimicrobium sp.]